MGKILVNLVNEKFHLGTPKTAFLMRHLPVDTRNLVIYANRQRHLLRFQKEQGRCPPNAMLVS